MEFGGLVNVVIANYGISIFTVSIQYGGGAVEVSGSTSVIGKVGQAETSGIIVTAEFF